MVNQVCDCEPLWNSGATLNVTLILKLHRCLVAPRRRKVHLSYSGVKSTPKKMSFTLPVVDTVLSLVANCLWTLCYAIAIANVLVVRELRPKLTLRSKEETQSLCRTCVNQCWFLTVNQVSAGFTLWQRSCRNTGCQLISYDSFLHVGLGAQHCQGGLLLVDAVFMGQSSPNLSLN